MDLVELAAGQMTQTRTCASKVMRRQLLYPGGLSRFLDDLPKLRDNTTFEITRLVLLSAQPHGLQLPIREGSPQPLDRSELECPEPERT